MPDLGPSFSSNFSAFPPSYGFPVKLNPGSGGSVDVGRSRLDTWGKSWEHVPTRVSSAPSSLESLREHLEGGKQSCSVACDRAEANRMRGALRAQHLVLLPELLDLPASRTPSQHRTATRLSAGEARGGEGK
eukprot:20445-Rhodomonas_salina.1